MQVKPSSSHLSLSRCAIFALLLFCFLSREKASAQTWNSFGSSYTFNEAVAAGRLRSLLEELARAVAQKPPNVEMGGLRFITVDENPQLLDLAWTIVAVGEYSKGGDEIKNALFAVQKQLGHLSVPYWIRPPERQIEIFATQSFANKSGASLPADVLKSQLVYRLALEAERKVTERTGYKFEGYDGPAYLDL